MPTDVVSSIPFTCWVQARLEAYASDDTMRDEAKRVPQSTQRMADELSVSDKTIKGWQKGMRRNGMPLFELPRATVEDVLERYDIPIWELYPRLETLDEAEFTGYAWCEQCQSTEQTYNERCAWHD